VLLFLIKAVVAYPDKKTVPASSSVVCWWSLMQTAAALLAIYCCSDALHALGNVVHNCSS
jgi:hypothetical protein